jgi:hypothetical protein
VQAVIALAHEHYYFRGLNGQTFAALGTAGTDHRPTAAGFHANQKAMGAFASHNGRLKGAFHNGS